MRKQFLTGAALLLTSLAWSQTKPLAGFSEIAAKQEFALEDKFDGYLKAADIDSMIRIMSSHPHHVGSPGDKKVADYIYDKFKGWGYDVQVETFYVLFPTPKERLLEMTGPTPY